MAPILAKEMVMDRRSSLFEHRDGPAPLSQGGAVSQARPAEGLRAPEARGCPPMRPVFEVTPPYGVPVLRQSGEMPSCERRGAQRLEVELDVSLGSDDHFFTATARDLSCGGLFVETYRALPLGGELSVEFELPAGRVVTRGVVCWVREARGGTSPGYGIAFREVSRFTRPLIDGFCKGLTAAPSSRRMAG
jgi:uncharacterized protein (TIGR02266 family)